MQYSSFLILESICYTSVEVHLDYFSFNYNFVSKNLVANLQKGKGENILIQFPSVKSLVKE